MADVKTLAEQLVGLTVKEVQELADVLKTQYGIEPAAAAAVEFMLATRVPIAETAVVAEIEACGATAAVAIA